MSPLKTKGFFLLLCASFVVSFAQDLSGGCKDLSNLTGAQLHWKCINQNYASCARCHGEEETTIIKEKEENIHKPPVENVNKDRKGGANAVCIQNSKPSTRCERQLNNWLKKGSLDEFCQKLQKRIKNSRNKERKLKKQRCYCACQERNEVEVTRKCKNSGKYSKKQCQQWKKEGGCSEKWGDMNEHCQKTCGFCNQEYKYGK